MPRRWTLSSCIVHRLDTPLPPSLYPRESHLFLSSLFSTDSQLLSTILLDKFFIRFLRTRGWTRRLRIIIVPSFFLYRIYISFIVEWKSNFFSQMFKESFGLRNAGPGPVFPSPGATRLHSFRDFGRPVFFPPPPHAQWTVVSRLDFRFWPGDDAASRSCPRGVFHSPSTRGGNRGGGRDLRPATVAPRN